MSSAFFKKINYSAANEDGETERRALAPHLAGGQAICITGSGSRALELLIDQPNRLVSIDFNATQSFLLELKAAAIREMEYECFLGFVGITASSNRLQDFEKIKGNLSSEARDFWSRESSKIQSGVIYCGSWEYYLSWMASFARLVRRKHVQRLMQCSSLEEQIEFWESDWTNFIWRTSLRMMGMRWIWKYVIREPGIAVIPAHVDIAEKINSRLDRAAHHVQLRQCAFAWLLFFGKYDPDVVLPCHLEKQHYPSIKSALDGLEIKTGEIDQYLSTTTDSFTAYSVSDFSSYAPQHVYERVWRSIQSSACNSGASICEREFLAPIAPQELEGVELHRDRELEAELSKLDRSMVYDIVVGRLN
ncbi:MAG: DUF3419 family protein [Planctomycetota bacterium]